MIVVTMCCSTKEHNMTLSNDMVISDNSVYIVTKFHVGSTNVSCLAEQNGVVNSTVAVAVLHVISAEEG